MLYLGLALLLVGLFADVPLTQIYLLGIGGLLGLTGGALYVIPALTKLIKKGSSKVKKSEEEDIEIDTQKLKESWSLKLAAWIFIVWGTVETLFLIALIRSGEKFSFSGGLFFYIYLGIQILRGKKIPYYNLLGFMILLGSLVLAGSFTNLICLIQIDSVKVIELINARTTNSLGYILNFYMVIIPILIALLYHPDSRIVVDNRKPKSCYIKIISSLKLTVIFVVLLSSSLTFLLAGPHAFKNPFGLVANEIVNSNLDRSGPIYVKEYGIHNWNFWSTWGYDREMANEMIKVNVSPTGEVSLSLEDPDR